MPLAIQKIKPTRTCMKRYADYKSYKSCLVIDYRNRCGYCDSHDRFFGGKKNFQIDHFKPHSIVAFTPLKHDYSNLVYSCQSCNRAKSNKWEYVDGFIDPCDTEYGVFLNREHNGKIIHNGTVRGQYIYKNLNLFLKRHELLWCIEKLEDQKNEIGNLLETGTHSEMELELLREFKKVQDEIDKYVKFLYVELSN